MALKQIFTELSTGFKEEYSAAPPARFQNEGSVISAFLAGMKQGEKESREGSETFVKDVGPFRQFILAFRGQI